METGMGAVPQEGRIERISHFLGEAGRRRVWRTAFAYAAIVFVLLQLGEIVFPAFGAPDWSLRLLVVACFLGFPLVLALAWAFDITPQGILRTQPDANPVRISDHSGSILPRLALVAVIVTTVGGVGWWTVQDTLRAQVPTAPGNSEGMVTAASMEAPTLQVRSLAVLPLDDYSEEEGGEYFTAGLHEELVSQLSQIGAARVVSRTSVVQYDATGKVMTQIAADLGVEGVVEGSVFRDGDRVRITVQLIHGPTDQHLWANSYEGTLEDAIGLQRTVATEIAREIQAELFPDKAWETPPTRVASTPRVQEEYLKGRFDRSKATPEALESALVHFESALEEDSSFAPAYAGLAGTRFLLEFMAGDSVSSDLLNDPQIIQPLERAFQLDEESPEARAVLLSLRETFGENPSFHLPAGVTIVVDSSSSLADDIALTASDFGRQLHRVVVRQGRKPGSKPGPSQAQRLVEARRSVAVSDFQSAEELVRDAIEAAPDSPEAWEALEQLRTIQGDYAGAAMAREERWARSGRGPEDGPDFRQLGNREAEGAKEGYWRTRLEELEEREAQGLRVSPVVMAKAHMSLHQTEEAFLELEKALHERDRNLISLWADPAWDSVRTDPRFREILSEARGGSGSDGGLFFPR